MYHVIYFYCMLFVLFLAVLVILLLLINLIWFDLQNRNHIFRRQMTGSRPNLHTMDPGKPASRVCSRSRSRSKVTWYVHFCAVTKIASSRRQMTGWRPNLHTMVPEEFTSRVCLSSRSRCTVTWYQHIWSFTKNRWPSLSQPSVLQTAGVYAGYMELVLSPSFRTLGVVGVLRVLVADAHNTSSGQKVPNFDYKPPFCLLQDKFGCPPWPYQKFKRKISSQFWDTR